MTKEQLQERIKALETERDSVRVSLMAYEGAIQDCNYWMSQLDAPVEAETPAES